MLHQVIFHPSLKKQSYHTQKVKPDEKGRNWLILSYNARERPNSWECYREDFIRLLPTEYFTASTLSRQSTSCQIWDFLPSCWGCLLTLRLEIRVPNDKFSFFCGETSCEVLLAQFWMILSPNKHDTKCFSSLAQAIVTDD